MTRYIASYDVENLELCLPAMEKLIQLHEQYEMPATMFIVGTLLEQQGREYRELWGDNPLFEVASHTHTHHILREHPFCGTPESAERIHSEIANGVARVEEVFERPCRGLRPGCGFVDGFQTAPEILAWCQEAKLDYVSSHLWGPEFTMPALLEQPYTYREQGHPDLWEIPGHGWHDNVLKFWNRDSRMLKWPPGYPETIPPSVVKTPEEEMQYNNRPYIDRAVAGGLDFVSLVWHPWSLHKFDPDLRMLHLTFQYVRDLGLTCTTYAGFCDELRQRQDGTGE